MEEGYSRKGLIKATHNNRIYDYIANHYHDMSKWDLKEVILTILGVCYDKCCGDEDEEALTNLIVEEFADRDFDDRED